MRLIDADELEEKSLPFETHGGGRFIALGSIRTAPTIDAVPVVRCGECVHRSRRPNCAGRHPDWFCADGERKE